MQDTTHTQRRLKLFVFFSLFVVCYCLWVAELFFSSNIISFHFMSIHFLSSCFINIISWSSGGFFSSFFIIISNLVLCYCACMSNKQCKKQQLIAFFLFFWLLKIVSKQPYEFKLTDILERDRRRAKDSQSEIGNSRKNGKQNKMNKAK